MLSTVEFADVAFEAMTEYGACHVGFGDGSGAWIGVTELGIRVSRRGHKLDGYGRTRSALEELERQGRARRHPSGADFWHPIGGGARG